MSRVTFLSRCVVVSLLGMSLLLMREVGSASVMADNSVGDQGPVATTEQVVADTAARYAASFGVDAEVAKARLELQDDIGRLEAALTEKHAPIYAGLWVEHQPDFKIVVLFTNIDEGKQTFQGFDPNLVKLIEVRQAKRTVIELEQARAQAAEIAMELGIQADSGVSLADNTAELYVLDKAQFVARLSQTQLASLDGVRVVQVEGLAKEMADIYGGLSGSTCTSGFSVVKWNGDKGVTFAGHCLDYQVVNGVGLSWMGGTTGGAYDIQWNFIPPQHTVRNWVWTGSYNMAIYFVKFRASQYVGEYVCKYGMTTGLGCGTIQDKNFDGVNVRVNVPVRDGDSGGPWFNNNVAYGTTISYVEGTNDSIYGPVDHIYNILGLSVITN